VEQKLKSHISYYFSEEHGNSMDAYTSLYSYDTVNKVKLPFLRLHKELGVPRLTNGDCAYGKQDLFAVVIALRYLLEAAHFYRFFRIQDITRF
jgi:hypothetical protein